MKHAPSVVFVSWQRSEHCYISLMYKTCSVSCHHLMTTVRNGYSSLRHATCSVSCHRPMAMARAWWYTLKYKTCSVSCHRLMTTVKAWLIILKVWNMLLKLLSSDDNGQSMVMYSSGMKHAPSVVFTLWQWTEHGYTSLRYEICSVNCHRLMTTVRAWLYPYFIRNVLVSLQ